MGGRSGMGELSGALNAPAIEERRCQLYFHVATVSYMQPQILLRRSNFGPTDMKMELHLLLMSVTFPRKTFV